MVGGWERLVGSIATVPLRECRCAVYVDPSLSLVAANPHGLWRMTSVVAMKVKRGIRVDPSTVAHANSFGGSERQRSSV